MDGDIRKTWMADPTDESTLWPQWLGEEIGCPVWLLGYSAPMTRWKASAQALPRLATAVIERLSNEPKLLEGPLILIGHSLGGLVIKTVLQHGMSRDIDRHKELARNIKGVAFMCTPHFGSKLATISARFYLIRANPHMNDLHLDNAHLETLNQYFLKLRTELGFKTRTFMETQPVRLPWWLGGRLWPGVTIVSPMSSDAHIPGEVGIPIEADHISICKPKDRSAAIHSSLITFIREVEAATSPPTNANKNTLALPSEHMEALSPELRTDMSVHLALSTFNVNLYADIDAPFCVSVYLVTDAPDRLCKQLQEIPNLILQDPLVNAAAKKRAQSSSLQQLVEDSGTKALVLGKLAVISFSAYMYYCPKESFNNLSHTERVDKLFVTPLVHRLSKKGERFEQVHTRLVDMDVYLKSATGKVYSAYNRSVAIPGHGAKKYTMLTDLAELIAQVCAKHLSAPEDAEIASLFEHFRTRIRYAENVSTGEKHLRDSNPLP